MKQPAREGATKTSPVRMMLSITAADQERKERRQQIRMGGTQALQSESSGWEARLCPLAAV